MKAFDSDCLTRLGFDSFVMTPLLLLLSTETETQASRIQVVLRPRLRLFLSPSSRPLARGRRIAADFAELLATLRILALRECFVTFWRTVGKF
jgi:hypothetical protein